MTLPFTLDTGYGTTLLAILTALSEDLYLYISTPKTVTVSIRATSAPIPTFLIVFLFFLGSTPSLLSFSLKETDLRLSLDFAEVFFTGVGFSPSKTMENLYFYVEK